MGWVSTSFYVLAAHRKQRMHLATEFDADNVYKILMSNRIATYVGAAA